MSTVQAALRRAETVLASGGVPDAAPEARALISALLGTSRTGVYLRARENLSAAQSKRFSAWLRRRRERRPLSYVTGEAAFGDLVLRVNESVLIPRPETEELFEKAMAAVPAGASWKIADIGTGSGCLAIALARALPSATVYATDISAPALKVARANARRLGIKNIRFRRGDLFAPLAGEKDFDLIVANLPYIRETDLAALDPEVLREPGLALSGGPDGLALIRRLAAAAPRSLKPGGLIFLEIGWNQGPAVVNLLKRSGFVGAACARDLSGHERIASGRLPAKEKK